MAEAHVLRVFADEAERFGNAVGVIIDDTNKYPSERRQQIAAALGFSESVFINDLQSLSISIFNPQTEIPFAGHAVVGVAWLLTKLLGREVRAIQGRDGLIQTWTEGSSVWVRSELKNTPPWWHERLESAAAIEALDGPQDPSQVYTQLWAWIDEQQGKIRSRTFAPGWGIPEDEANGSGCMRLAATLGRQIEVLHGKGSVIYAKLGGPGHADVGGRVVQDEARTI